jgi:hypothetical protein
LKIFLVEGVYPPVAFPMPMQQVHFAVSPQYGHTHLQSSIKFPQFMQRGFFVSVISLRLCHIYVVEG